VKGTDRRLIGPPSVANNINHRTWHVYGRILIMPDLRELSALDAYRAMICFLEDYFSRTRSEEIGILLGGLALNQDGQPMDPACWHDWITAVDKVRGGGK
jgi:hypothetical protein